MNKNYPTIDILLSTFNGEKYLEDLLNSLLSQSYRNWRLIIRDDGSNDSTLNILKNFKENLRENILIIEGSNIGPKSSFEQLLIASQSQYIMFCDQDDVWHRKKIETAIRKLAEIEHNSPYIPCLVYSDLSVVDENLIMISKSFWEYHKITPIEDKEPRLFLENPGAGCTMIFNRSVIKHSLPFPKNIVMHDWWLLLVTTYFGRVAYIKSPMISYRQHYDNKVGANSVSITRVWFALKRLQKEINIATNLYRGTLRQAEEFLQKFEPKLEKNDKKLVKKFIKSGKSSIITRKRIFIENNFLYSNSIRKIFQLLFL